MGEGSSNTRITDSVSTGETQQSGEPTETENSFAGQAVGQIEALVESFRTGKVSKLQTIFKIAQIIAGEPSGDEQLKSDSLERYAITLDGIEALSAKADEHGQWFSDPILGKRKDDSGGRDKGHEQFDRDNSANAHTSDVDDFFEQLSHGNVPQGGDDDLGGGSSSDESSINDHCGTHGACFSSI
jgi:hypothetical protein